MNFNPYRRREFLRQGSGAVLALAGLSLGTGSPARAQGALLPLSVLCSGPAGSIPDIVARRVAEQLSGHPYPRALVDNRPGAAGQIAVGALKAAPADGSVMLLAQGAIATVYPYLYARLAYDPASDIKPVSVAGEMTLALAIGPAVPASVETVPDLVAWFRANPKRANVGSPGTGTLPHLLEALLFRMASVDWQHVAYAGGPPALTDLMGGQIAALVLPEGLLRQHRAAGRLRVLATSGAGRSTYLPDVPSLVEQGYADLVVREWFGFFMPGRVSPAVLESSSQALRAALAQPALVTAFAESGMDAVSSTPAGMAARITAEQRYWQPVIRAQAIKAD
jgi:tripartite-type tricarboxylate transporter receptor subunit TctC